MSEIKVTRQLLIAMERARLFYAGLGFAGVATLLLSALVYKLAPEVGGTPVRLLTGGLILTGVIQLGTWYAWNLRKPDLSGVRPWLYYPLLSTLPAGLCWGAMTAYLLPYYHSDTGLLILLTISASGLLSILLLSALEMMVLLFFACFLAALLGVFRLDQLWPSGSIVTVLLALVLGLGVVAAAVSQLSGIIARLRAGKQNATGKLDQARMQMEGLNTRLNDQDEHRREVERKLYLAKEAAETANMVKGEFLATMSHEIRTPLNGIVPLLEILRESELDREQRQFVTTALNSSYHLLSIINDILDFSKIEAGKLDLESIELNLQELVESVVTMMAKSAERRGLELDYRIAPDLPRTVRGDPIRLRQVLTNLVSNAIKFTAKGSVMVEVASRGRSRKTVEVFFAVKDTGDGISEETQARLFRPFNQADASTTRKHGGTGLGLVISRRLVELMDGKIGVRSEVGTGSVFWFLVPMRKSLRDIPADRRSLQGVRVLMLDDNDQHAQSVEHFLDEWGVLHQRADNTMDALSNLISTANLGESWAYELLILDSKTLVGRLSGLLRQINDEPVLGGLKLLVVGDVARSSDKLGVDATITRPVKKSDLYRTLCRLLDVQDELSSSARSSADQPTNQFLYADAQDNAWAETVPLDSLGRTETDPASDVQLMGHVLLVEDNLVNLNVAKKILLRLGLECDVAQDGLAALTAIDNYQYDLVLMDCQMPRMDGYEATRAIRLREATKGLARLPVIAMTANAMEGDRQKCLDAGMDDYLSKPVMPATLRLMLCQWLPRNELDAPEAAEDNFKPTGDTTRYDVPDEEPEGSPGQPQDIDRSVLDELHEIMEDDLVTLLLSFLDTAPGLIREIEAGILDRDPEQVILPAHSLKSSSANVGALKLSDIARQIEHAAREGDMGRVSAAFKGLNQAFDGADRVLRRVCEQGLDELSFD